MMMEEVRKELRRKRARGGRLVRAESGGGGRSEQALAGARRAGVEGPEASAVERRAVRIGADRTDVRVCTPVGRETRLRERRVVPGRRWSIGGRIRLPSRP